MNAKPEAQSDDCNVICPYCRYEYQPEAASYTDDEIEDTCDECGETFLRHDEFSITHHTRPKKDA